MILIWILTFIASKASAGNINPNNALLYSTTHPFPAERPVEVLTPGQLSNLTQKFNHLNQDYEVRKDAGIVKFEDEIAHAENLSNFSKGVVSEVENNYLNRQKSRLKPYFLDTTRELDRNAFFHALKKPVSFAVVAFAIYSGKTIDVFQEQELKISARASMPSQTAQVIFASSGTGGVFTWSPTDTAGATVTQQLTSRLSLAVDVNHVIPQAGSKERILSENIRLSYGFQF